MQDETPNTIEGLSEDDLQRIAGGCGPCAPDVTIATATNKILRLHRVTTALGRDSGMTPQVLQQAKNQGQEAVNRMIERHPHPIVANAIRGRYPELRDQ